MSRRDEIGNVYFLKSEESGRIKIGYTAGAPVDRMKALQTGTPERLRLLVFVPGTMATEASLHDKFRGERIVGEWFAPSDELEHFIGGVLFAQEQDTAAGEARARAEREAAAAARAEQVRKEAAARFMAERSKPILSKDVLAKTAEELLAKIAVNGPDQFAVAPPPRRRPM